MNITDIDGNIISMVPLAIEGGADSQVFVIETPCPDGYWLTSSLHPDAQVLARRNGTADTFLDLYTNPIDLSPDSPGVARFDLKVHNDTVAAIQREILEVKVTPNP
jgi:hypothetical protein